MQLPGWHQLYNEDVTISEVLTEAGYATALIADLPHLQRPGRNFHRGYKYYEWVRGQENDYYALAPRKQPDYLDLYPADYLERSELNRQFAKQPEQTFKDFLNQYTANRRRWRKDGESIVELTSRNAVRWLKENTSGGAVLPSPGGLRSARAVGSAAGIPGKILEECRRAELARAALCEYRGSTGGCQTAAR